MNNLVQSKNSSYQIIPPYCFSIDLKIIQSKKKQIEIDTMIQNRQDQCSKAHPITLIRHGQSQYNDQAQILRNKLGIGATWQQYKANPQFMRFKYSDEMMDCRLSAKGKKQCEKLRQQLEQGRQREKEEQETGGFDLILVSPLFRALESCSIIFSHIIDNNNRVTLQKNTNESCNYHQKYIPIIVDPIFSQSLRCACDVSYNLLEAKKQFPFYNYSLVEGRQSQWYIDNQLPTQQATYRQLLKQNNINGYKQTAVFITRYMEQTHNYEGGVGMVTRAGKARERIREYQQKYKRIAIVSHFYLIGYLITEPTLFDEKGKPLTKFDVPNAHPIQYSL